MVENKYPKYVSTDMDIWNSADEAYFFVTKKKAKLLTTIITPIIEEALESGLLREATKEEIKEYELEQEIEKKIQERKIEKGKTYEETLDNYNKWLENNNNKKILKPTSEEFVKESKVVKTVNEISDKTQKSLRPTENALKQKATIRTDNM